MAWPRFSRSSGVAVSVLLRQPHGLEGLGDGRKRCDIDRLLIADSNCMREPRRGLRSAADTAHVDNDFCYYRVVTSEPAQDFERRPFDCVGALLPPPTHTVVSPIDSRIRRDVPLVKLDIRVKSG